MNFDCAFEKYNLQSIQQQVHANQKNEFKGEGIAEYIAYRA